MNRFERVIAAVAPVYASRRALARVRIGVASDAERRMNKSAGGGRRFYEKSDGSWGINTGDPNDARPRRIVDRIRIERLVATNPYGRKILTTLVNNMVGWGITGAPKGTKQLKKAWGDWVKVADWYKRLNLYGLQEIAVAKMLSPGEVFIVRRTVKVGFGKHPLRLQLIDARMLATTKFGTNVIDGIEYDEDGLPVRYHFYRRRPGLSGWTSMDTVSFDAADVIHLYVAEDVGQTRGRSVFEPVVKKLDDIDETMEADLVRRKIESCFVGFRTMEDQGQPDAEVGTDRTTDDDGRVSESMEPGMITTLLPGESIEFGDPTPSGGVAEAVKINLFAVAAGANVMYEHFGDLSNVNYSSYRAGHIEFRRYIGRVQWNTIIPVALDRIWDWWIADAITLGLVGARDYEMKWTPPPFESVDPEKEANGQLLQLSAGLESHRNIVNGYGYDFEDLMAEIAEDNAIKEKLKLSFITYTKGGQAAPADSAKSAAKA
jgi:lambda family phage portal protein